jgi:hypothetical protein
VVPQPEATSGSLADKFLSLPSTYWISEHEGGSWLSAFSSPCSQDAVRHFCFPGGLLEPQTPCRFIQVAESLPVLTCGNLWARCNGNVPNPSGDSLQSQKRLSVRGGLYPSSSHSPGVLSSDLPICVQDTFGRSPSTMWQVTFKPWLFLPCPSHSMVFTPSYRSSLKTLHLAVFLLQWSVQSWRQGQGDWTIALPHTLFFFFFLQCWGSNPWPCVCQASIPTDLHPQLSVFETGPCYAGQTGLELTTPQSYLGLQVWMTHPVYCPFHTYIQSNEPHYSTHP